MPPRRSRRRTDSGSGSPPRWRARGVVVISMRRRGLMLTAHKALDPQGPRPPFPPGPEPPCPLIAATSAFPIGDRGHIYRVATTVPAVRSEGTPQVTAADGPAAAGPRVPMSEALATTRVMAILRAENASRAEAVVDVLLENGIRSLELTLTTKGALEVVERLAATVPEG